MDEQKKPLPGQECPTCGHRAPMTVEQRVKAFRARKRAEKLLARELAKQEPVTQDVT